MTNKLTIEQVKEQMRDYISSEEYFGYDKGRTEIIKFWLDVLDRLEPPDAKLRKVREEVEAFHKRCDPVFNTMTLYFKVLSIIDSHLTPSEPSELEKLRKEAEDLISRINNSVRELGE